MSLVVYLLSENKQQQLPPTGPPTFPWGFCHSWVQGSLVSGSIGLCQI